jgi:hypothetical protein
VTGHASRPQALEVSGTRFQTLNFCFKLKDFKKATTQNASALYKGRIERKINPE